MSNSIKLSIFSILFISSIAYPMEIPNESEDDTTLQNELSDYIVAENAMKNLTNVLDTKLMKVFCSATIHDEVPAEAYYRMTCPKCSSELKAMRIETLEIKIRRHSEGVRSTCPPLEKTDYKITPPSQFFRSIFECPLFGKKQKNKKRKACDYSEEKEAVSLRTLTRKPEQLQRHLRTCHKAEYTKKSLEQYITYCKTDKKIKKITHRKRSASDFENLG